LPDLPAEADNFAEIAADAAKPAPDPGQRHSLARFGTRPIPASALVFGHAGRLNGHLQSWYKLGRERRVLRHGPGPCHGTATDGPLGAEWPAVWWRWRVLNEQGEADDCFKIIPDWLPPSADQALCVGNQEGSWDGKDGGRGHG
jgi:hypothetical protein